MSVFGSATLGITSTMSALVQNVKDAEIEAIAAYLSTRS